jgi:hypothetical protein
MLLNVLSRKGDGCRAMQQLIARCHETPKAKKAHVKRAWQLFRSLVERKIVEFTQVRSAECGVRNGVRNQSLVTLLRQKHYGGLASAATGGAKLRVNVDLQDDFSMDQTLSLYLLETIPLIDPQAPDYALVLLTLVESILEDPDIILRKQLDKIKSQKMAEMKMEGIEFDKRIEELEKLEYPKPNREFIYSTFNAFAARHPWVGQENIRPKSIAREMFESFRSFSDYIRDYELQRAEGVLLRHLNSVFKVLGQTVPDAVKNETVLEMELYLGTMIRQIDSSLLDEWEKMRDPNYQRTETKEARPPGAEEAAADITRDAKVFMAAIRTRIFGFLRGLVNADFEQAIGSLSSPKDMDGMDWTAERLSSVMKAYHAEHERICLDPNARNGRHTHSAPSEDKRTLRVQQMLVDPEEHNDWMAEFEVDLAESRQIGEPALRLRRIASLI